MKLTMAKAVELNRGMVQENLILHSKNVMVAMEAMARHFGADAEHWKAICIEGMKPYATELQLLGTAA